MANLWLEDSTINVTVDAVNDAIKNSLVLKGNQITMPDTKDTSQTHFRIWVTDKVKDSLSGVITFKINIVSPNDNYPTVDQDWFSGYDQRCDVGCRILWCSGKYLARRFNKPEFILIGNTIA